MPLLVSPVIGMLVTAVVAYVATGYVRQDRAIRRMRRHQERKPGRSRP